MERTTFGVEPSSLMADLGVNESGFGVKNDNRVRCLFPAGVPFVALLVADLSLFLGVLLSMGAFGMLAIMEFV